MIEITAEYLASQGLWPNFPQRLWAKIDIREPWECWPWLAYRMPNGYGQIGKGGHNGRMILAHRAVWIVTNGAVPKGIDVCHDCPGEDHPWCCNPSHLWLGPPSANSCDMVEKGRSTFGERNPMATLNERKVRAIRALYESGEFTLDALAEKFRVAKAHISNIVNFKRWRHVSPN